MTKFIQILFCTDQCKKLSKNTNNHKLIKFITLFSVSLLFSINIVGMSLQLVFMKSHLFVIILYAIYGYLIIITSVNYFMTAFLDPGSITTEAPKMERTCVLCQKVKPMRSHHCSQCQKCVLKMDHHCPWIAQCVGYNNYGQFFSLMLFSSLTMLYSLTVMIIQLFLNIFLFKISIKDNIPFIVVSSVSILITGAFGFITTKLFVFHIHLIRNNLTTIEFYELQASQKLDPLTINHYDLHAKSNVKQIIPYPALMLIPGCRIKGQFNPYFSYDYRNNRELRVQTPQSAELIEQELNVQKQENQDNEEKVINKRRVLPPIRQKQEGAILSQDIESQITNYTGQILPANVPQE